MPVLRIDTGHASYEPSPLEIWRQCSDIRATWSRDEERKRRAVAEEPWLPPGFNHVMRIGVSSRIRFH
jgi:hypothetical protein